MPLVTYENCQIVYFNNNFNKLYNSTNVTGTVSTNQDTGWHLIPNQLYQNWMTPRQWFDLVTNHDKYRPHSCEVTVQNMIPLTDNLSIDQSTTFMTFNNTIYALGYTDKHYETFLTTNPMSCLYKEGAIFTFDKGDIQSKLSLPIYNHKLIKSPDGTLYQKGYGWDPFIHPSSLMELRPGKNAIKFSWSADPVDSDKWYSTSIQNLTVQSSSLVTDKHLQNTDYRTQIITPGQLQKEDPRNDFKRNEILLYHKLWRYPINNWFIKMVPILNSNNALLKHEAQVVLVRKFTFEVTPRTNTTNFPQLQNKYASDSAIWTKFTDAPSIRYDLAYRPSDNQGQNPPDNDMDTTQVIPDMPAKSKHK